MVERDMVSRRISVRFIMMVLFFLYFFLSLLRMQVSNEDFWWHLATGKYIVEHQSLPEHDPFLFTSRDTHSPRKSFILQGYWLAQVLFYGVHAIGDLQGVIVLRAVFLSGMLFFVFVNTRKQAGHGLVALALLTGVFWYALIAEGERPQLFTFFFFSVVYYLLEDFRISRSRKIVLVPPIFLLLANMHPGYVICAALVSLYLVAEGVRCVLRKSPDWYVFKGLFVVWLMSLLVSLLNPNRWDIFIQLVTTRFFTESTMHVVEMLPTFQLYSEGMIPVDYSYIAFLALSLLSLKYMRKTGIVHMSLLVVFTVMSLASYRYVMFYMCIACPILAGAVRSLGDARALRKMVAGLKAREVSLSVAACVLGVLLVASASVPLAGFQFRGNEMYFVPRGAADFLRGREIRGNMFNEYGFGGYLIWRLFPGKKAFIDTRSLEPDITREYMAVAFAVESPPLSWEAIMRKYGISYVVTRPLWQNGKVMPIVQELLDNDGWVLVYADHLSLIFVRNDSGNGPLTEQYAIDKARGLDTIVAQASAWALTGGSANPNYFITLGETFFRLGKLQDAEKAFVMASARDPGNRRVREWLRRLDGRKRTIDGADGGGHGTANPRQPD